MFLECEPPAEGGKVLGLWEGRMGQGGGKNGQGGGGTKLDREWGGGGGLNDNSTYWFLFLPAAASHPLSHLGLALVKWRAQVQELPLWNGRLTQGQGDLNPHQSLPILPAGYSTLPFLVQQWGDRIVLQAKRKTVAFVGQAKTIACGQTCQLAIAVGKLTQIQVNCYLVAICLKEHHTYRYYQSVYVEVGAAARNLKWSV